MSIINSASLYADIMRASIDAPEDLDGIDYHDRHLTFKTATGSIKLIRTKARLQQFAADMLKTWKLWGGGEKPASDKPKKAPSQWKAGTVRVVAELLEDGDYSAALELAERECGGIVCQSETGAPVLFYAREQIEGMPEGVEVGKTCAGNWVVAHGKTGRVILNTRGKNTKASALDLFARASEQWSAEDFAEVLARLTACDFESARATWMMQNGIAPAPESIPHVADAAPVEALPVPEVAPVAQAVEPAPVEPAPVPEVAELAPAKTGADFAQDIPRALAVNAYAGTSFSPERRGDSVRAEYAATMAGDLEYFTAQATRGGTLEMLPDLFATYRARIAGMYRAWLASSSRCVSSMIAGPSNFPAARMNKRADIAHRRLTEMLEGREMARRALARKLRPDLRPIMSGDADAIDRLAAKIAQAESVQERMKAANAAIRKYQKSGLQAQVAALLELGFLESQALEVLHRPAHLAYLGQGFPRFELTNNGANIRRMRERLEHLERMAEKPAKELEGANGIRAEDNPPENRIRIFFPGKPSEEVRTTLKGAGFRWAPSIGAWQAYRNARTIEIAREMVGELAPETATPEAVPDVTPAAPHAAEAVADTQAPEAPEPASEAPDALNMTVPEAQAMPATEYTITIKPLRAGGKPSAIVRCPSPDGYKTRAARLAGSIARGRYSRRHGGYIMSVAASVRFEALYSAGAEACAVTGDIYHTVAAPAPVAIAAPASPEYVALRSAARAARRVAVAAINAARVSSAQAAPAPARAQADDGNPYPYLIPTEGQRGGVAAAKNIRLVLKNEFPGIKFRVTSDYSSVHVKWTDGPTSAQVDQALAPFDIGHSDSQSDYFYTTSTRFSDTFGGVQYLFTNRALSDAAIGASLSAVFGPNGPSVEDYHNARAWHQVQHGTFTGAQMLGGYEWMAMVRSHADGSE